MVRPRLAAVGGAAEGLGGDVDSQAERHRRNDAVTGRAGVQTTTKAARRPSRPRRRVRSGAASAMQPAVGA